MAPLNPLLTTAFRSTFCRPKLGWTLGEQLATRTISNSIKGSRVRKKGLRSLWCVQKPCWEAIHFYSHFLELQICHGGISDLCELRIKSNVIETWGSFSTPLDAAAFFLLFTNRTSCGDSVFWLCSIFCLNSASTRLLHDNLLLQYICSIYQFTVGLREREFTSTLRFWNSNARVAINLELVICIAMSGLIRFKKESSCATQWFAEKTAGWSYNAWSCFLSHSKTKCASTTSLVYH